MPHNPECTACPLGKTAGSVCVWGENYISNLGVPSDESVSSGMVLIIGEAPGADEDRHARPWVGKAGTALRTVLDQIPTHRSYYLTNAVKCRPPRNRRPKMEEIRACSKYLTEEIKAVQPAVIVALGSTAIKALTGERTVSVSEYRGRLRWSWEGIPVVASYHPAAALRDPSHWPRIIDDLYRAQSNEIERPEEIVIHTADGPRPYNVMALDLETTGLNPWDRDGQILAWAISTKANEAYAELGSPKAKLLYEDALMLVGHNIKFDLSWLRAHEGFVHHGRVLDTMVLAHLLDENAPSKGLKWLATQYTGLGEYDAPVREARKKGKMEEVDWDTLLKYVGYDAGATFLLYERMWPMIQRQGLETLARAQGRVVLALTAIESHGLTIDKEALDALDSSSRKRMLELERWLTEQYPIESLRSPRQVGDLLHRHFKMPVVHRTPAGQPSTDERTLQAMRTRASGDVKTVLDSLLEYRGCHKVIRSYLDPIRAGMDPDGKIHPNFNVCGTVTGRLSCSRPNLQNFPRQGGPRKLIVPSPGSTLIQADYSQMELRIMAHLSKDPTMTQLFLDGADLHTETAKRIYHTEEPTKEMRTLAKTVNFGVLYGAGPNRIAEETGLSFREAAGLVSDWFKVYPGVHNWIRETAKTLLDTGEIVSMYGRKRRLLKFVTSKAQQKRLVRQACNFPIQSAAAETCLLAMTRLHELGFWVVGNIHDAVLVDCRDEVLEKTARTISNVMSNVDQLARDFGFDVSMTIPMPVEVSHGASWDEQRPLEVR